MAAMKSSRNQLFCTVCKGMVTSLTPANIIVGFKPSPRTTSRAVGYFDARVMVFLTVPLTVASLSGPSIAMSPSG